MRKLNYKHALVVIGILLVLITAGLTFKGLQAMNAWYDTHYLQFNQVVKIAFSRPVEVKEREKVQVIEKKIVLDYPDEIDTPIEKYICDKFGPYDCKTALAVAKAESGLREDAININTNGTVDIGLFQINSVHFKKDGCSLKEVVVAEKNADCAYQIFQASGWNPWVAYQNGNYIAKLE